MLTEHAYPITDAAAWKGAVTAHLTEHGVSRYALTRAAHAAEVCASHTCECLLASPDTVTGQRMPSLALAIDIARLAGLDLVLVARAAPLTPRP